MRRLRSACGNSTIGLGAGVGIRSGSRWWSRIVTASSFESGTVLQVGKHGFIISFYL